MTSTPDSNGKRVLIGVGDGGENVSSETRVDNEASGAFSIVRPTCNGVRVVWACGSNDLAKEPSKAFGIFVSCELGIRDYAPGDLVVRLNFTSDVDNNAT